MVDMRSFDAEVDDSLFDLTIVCCWVLDLYANIGLMRDTTGILGETDLFEEDGTDNRNNKTDCASGKGRQCKWEVFKELDFAKQLGILLCWISQYSTNYWSEEQAQVARKGEETESPSLCLGRRVLRKHGTDCSED